MKEEYDFTEAMAAARLRAEKLQKELIEARDTLLRCQGNTTAMVLKIHGLFDAIKHGDAEHQRWLKEKIDAHFARTGDSP